MAVSRFLALLDDIATILDDVAVLSKLAVKKTTGVLGDDLALNAQQVAGVQADRELPVVWAVAKGSLLNKAILVPAALLISVIAPWAILPLLMVGGAYLCFEGAEKVLHRLLHARAEDEAAHAARRAAVQDGTVDLVQLERDKIRGAVRTDFILSAEIVVIALGTVASHSFAVKVAVLSVIAVVMTAGVYGLVAGIVKLDDLGLYLAGAPGDAALARARRSFGQGILRAAPWLMKTLSVVGTAAMFLVGGSIVLHGIAPAQHAVQQLLAPLSAAGGLRATLAWLTGILADGLTGLLVGVVIVGGVTLGKRLVIRRAP